MTWALFVDSSNSVSFMPNWDLSEPDAKVQSDHRTKTGKLYRYKWGSWGEFKFSVEFVNSSDASKVNGWWLNNTQLLFMNEDTTSVSSVVIMNKTKPLTSRVAPMVDQFKGTISLGTY